jgi:hypothetical protein
MIMKKILLLLFAFFIGFNPVFAISGSSSNSISFHESVNLDAFGRLRVSNPKTIFDAKNIYDDPDIEAWEENQPLFFDNQETDGSGTSTNYVVNEAAQYIRVTSGNAGTRTRQTKQYFNYQPGKSRLTLMSFVMGTQHSGIDRREGAFNSDNGIFLEDDGTNYKFVLRSNVTGTPVERAVNQDDWIDPMDGSGPSRIDLDFTKAQLMWIDIEYLGVGDVRLGFVCNGQFHLAYVFENTNRFSTVYMSTPNLPLTSQITNDGTGPEATLVQICSTVISEGDEHPVGATRWATSGGTEATATTENVIIPIIGIRLKDAYIGETVDIINTSVQVQTTSDKVEYFLLLNPTVTGTFTYADESNSAVQIARWSDVAVVTGGTPIGAPGYAEAGGFLNGSAGSAAALQDNALKLGALIDGTMDEIVLCARPIADSSAVELEGQLVWKEYN